MAKKKKTSNILGKLLLLIYFLTSTIFCGILYFLRMLPIKYYSTLLGVYLLFLIILVFFTLSKRKKRTYIICGIVCFLLSCIFSCGLYYLNSTMHFMDKIIASNYQIENYYLFVLKDSKYNSLNDLVNKEIGFSNSDNKNYKKFSNEIDNKIKYSRKDYSSIIDLGNDLLNKKVDSIFVDEATLSFIKEEISDFENKTKVIYNPKNKIKINNKSKKVSVTKEPFNIYISGIDVYGDISSVSRSDVNMIVTVNPNTHKILLTSIPRDYYITLPGKSGCRDKLTHSGLYGVDTTVEIMEKLLGIDINYNIRVNFTTLISLVDKIDGIDLYSDKSFKAYTNRSCAFIKGNQHVDGKCALAFARERYAYSEGDRHRVKNQQDVLIAIINKVTSSTLITKYNSILNSLGDSFQTNMPKDNIYSLINKQIETMAKWDFEQISLDGYGKKDYTCSYRSTKLYVMEPDKETIFNAKNKIKEVYNETK